MVPYVWRRDSLGDRGAPTGARRVTGRAKPTPRWVLWSLVGDHGRVRRLPGGLPLPVRHRQLDAASYMQFASWISTHGSLPIPQDAAVFGHASGITFAERRVLPGRQPPSCPSSWPGCRCCSRWASGRAAPGSRCSGRRCSARSPCFTFGGLVARLVGPALGAVRRAGDRRSPSPMQYVSRSTYSEPLAQILSGRRAVAVDRQPAHRPGRRKTPDGGGANWRHHARSASHVLAGVTGLLFGITLLVRIDGPADILFVIPYCGLLVLRRQRQVIPLIVGMIVGTVYGTVDGAFLTLPYLKTNTQSVEVHGRRVRRCSPGTERGGLVAAAARLGAPHPAEPAAGQGRDGAAVRRDRRLPHPALRGAELARARSTRRSACTGFTGTPASPPSRSR